MNRFTMKEVKSQQIQREILRHSFQEAFLQLRSWFFFFFDLKWNEIKKHNEIPYFVECMCIGMHQKESKIFILIFTQPLNTKCNRYFTCFYICCSFFFFFLSLALCTWNCIETAKVEFQPTDNGQTWTEWRELK